MLKAKAMAVAKKKTTKPKKTKKTKSVCRMPLKAIYFLLQLQWANQKTPYRRARQGEREVAEDEVAEDEVAESGDWYVYAIEVAEDEVGAKEIKEEPKEVKQEIKQEIKEESWDDYSPQDGKEAAEMSGDRD